MPEFTSIFPILFVGLFILVLFLLSKKGWSDLENAYRFSDTFHGKRAGIISAGINGVNYKNCLILKYNDQGFYLKPIFIFRLFHPPVMIPWKDIISVQDKKVLFVRVKELVIGNPTIALIIMNQRTIERLPFIKKSSK
jgi:hypothetical protein